MMEFVVSGCILHLGLADLGVPGCRCRLYHPFIFKYPDVAFHVSFICYMIVFTEDETELVYSFCWPGFPIFPCIRQLFDQPGISQVQHKLTLLTLGGIRSCVTATFRFSRQPLLSTARTTGYTNIDAHPKLGQRHIRRKRDTQGSITTHWCVLPP